MSWPPPFWTELELKTIATYVLKTANPYKHSKLNGAWQVEALIDKGPLYWPFRGDTLKIERALSFPIDVRYPRVNNPTNTPEDWNSWNTKETLVVGFVGSGGH